MGKTRTGPECKFYVNEGTYALPEWTEVDLVADAAIDGTYTEADSSARQAAVQTQEPLLVNLSVTLRVRKDSTDAAYNLLRDAYIQKLLLDILYLDGPDDENDVTGFRYDAKVFSFGEDQALGNVLYNNVTVKPVASENNPQAVRVTAGAPVFQEIGVVAP